MPRGTSFGCDLRELYGDMYEQHVAKSGGCDGGGDFVQPTHDYGQHEDMRARSSSSHHGSGAKHNAMRKSAKCACAGEGGDDDDMQMMMLGSGGSGGMDIRRVYMFLLRKSVFLNMTQFVVILILIALLLRK